MVRTASTMLELGTPAPTFSLPAAGDGGTVSLSDYEGKPLLVMFISNHCPFVKHLRSALAEFGEEYESKGLSIVAIGSNDAVEYPDDSFEKMAEEKADAGYTFPYVYDEDQSVAKAYKAACTPDFFLFDSSHKLAYRGQFDDSRPGNDLPVDGGDLRAAAEQVIAGAPVPPDQKPSIGCNIKWKDAPDYFTGQRAE
ncbi:thioredoxin family protein [Alienimonas chondri]|uniref:Thiol-disulfide oxidoreductase ResA n=1 Tax=Alienimonas chondri TaxID=2681879 RepID=A0ABX1VEM8_9PLAN|nr:thioredoxin family protein [Alienimonas chondri]NNJ25742.1 Thiol-disulfide oxidoreductase ResA [Alienimonas chondri]